MTEQHEKYANELENALNQLSETVNKIVTEMFSLKDKAEKDWKMKCPYEYGDKHYCVQSSGDVFSDSWHDIEADYSYFSQGNIFPTREAAKLEVKRRNLLTRFRAFRDECNGDWKPDWTDSFTSKYLLSIIDSKLVTDAYWYANKFNTFGYFKNEKDAERAIELFGDEIKELFIDCECD